ncbi:MAG TPA: FAD-binding protein [Acidimicrobiales bacterium]|nr:FAD-binding protein [Acidimicrobiales bacterium]
MKVAAGVHRPEVPGIAAVRAFAEEVGPTEAGLVTVVGGRTQWDVGGSVEPSVRTVRAPSGIVKYAPAEMIVRVGAGTTVAELDASLAAAGQMVALDPHDPIAATVGGVLAVGRSGPRRLRWGPVRDTVLETHFVTAAGAVARAGGPVVKNVTGFDLSRLLVGSLGTLAFIAQVVLRTQPRPAVSQWWRVPGADPTSLVANLFRPSSILWDGTTAWVLLEGHAADVHAQARLLGAAAELIAGAPALPSNGRVSMPPNEAARLGPESFAGGFVAEIGVGVVHTAAEAAAATLAPETAAVTVRLKAAFDPTGRLNPGRTVG